MRPFNFPGKHAWASLKHFRCMRIAQSAFNFPGKHAWASLKRLCQAVGWAWAVQFPRQTRLGLIEAFSVCCSAWVVAANFPGKHAWASLKHLALRTLPALDRDNFPGKHAWASLKRKIGQQSITRAPKFPRQTRLGLIEANCSSVGAASAMQFPRQTRLGLIEALSCAS